MENKVQGHRGQTLQIGEITFGETARNIMSKNLRTTDRENIVKHICALMNSDGGVLRAKIRNEITFFYKKDALGQDLEKAFIKLLKPGPVQDLVQIKQCGNELWFNVKPRRLAEKRRRLFGIDSGLQMRSLTQVKRITTDNVVTYFSKRRNQEHNITGDPVYNKACQFYEEGRAELNQSLDFGEGVHVELKSFENEKNLIKRLKECLPRYISAFANTRGGFLFIGINDEKIVVGCGCGLDLHYLEEKIKEICDKPRDRTVHMHGCTAESPWSPEMKVFPVTSAAGKVAYVIGIKVPPFCCAVFEKDPESWEIVEDEISQLKCSEWLKRKQSPLPGILSGFHLIWALTARMWNSFFT